MSATSDTPGQLEPLEARVARVLCGNASPYTYTGTWTHLVGTRSLAVIDPGPDRPEHLAALLAAIDGRPVEAIAITHNHRDHSPLAPALAAATGAPIVGAAPIVGRDDGPRADDGFDHGYAPDRVLAHGEALTGADWTLTAVHTPGHTSNHLCFALDDAEGRGTALFSGDHVMGWSTTVVAPPDGDMEAYMASLELLLARTGDRIYYPAHGDPVTNPQRLVRGQLGHRKQREGQILRLLAAGTTTLPEMVARMYVGLDPRLLPAAELSVRAHLIDLGRRGLACEQDRQWNAS